MYRRGKIWWTTVGGVRKSSGTSVKKDAEAYFARLRHENWEQQKMGVKPPRSWEEAVVRYLKECEGQAGYGWKKTILRWWAEQIGKPRDITQIDRQRVADICDGLATVEPSPGNTTLNYRIWVLHNLLKKASSEWEWIEKAPKFRTYPKATPRDLWLNKERVMSLFGAVPTGGLSDFCALALATGLRSSKVTGMMWSQYDSSRKVLMVQGSGNKRANPIPLNQTAIAVLEARRRAPMVDLIRVFPEIKHPPIIQYKAEWARVRQIPGLERVGPHTLRHTFNTWLAQAGVAREVREYLMGHRAMDTNAIYTHWAEETLRPAVEVIDRILTAETHNLVHLNSLTG